MERENQNICNETNNADETNYNFIILIAFMISVLLSAMLNIAFWYFWGLDLLLRLSKYIHPLSVLGTIILVILIGLVWRPCLLAGFGTFSVVKRSERKGKNQDRGRDNDSHQESGQV